MALDKFDRVIQPRQYAMILNTHWKSNDVHILFVQIADKEPTHNRVYYKRFWTLRGDIQEELETMKISNEMGDSKECEPITLSKKYNDIEEIELHTDKNNLDVVSEFKLDEKAFFDTFSNNINDVIDRPGELYDSFEKINTTNNTDHIKVVNINSEDGLKINESDKLNTDKIKEKNKNYLNDFQTHNTN